jgi:hypothetical protein
VVELNIQFDHADRGYDVGIDSTYTTSTVLCAMCGISGNWILAGQLACVLVAIDRAKEGVKVLGFVVVSRQMARWTVEFVLLNIVWKLGSLGRGLLGRSPSAAGITQPQSEITP